MRQLSATRWGTRALLAAALVCATVVVVSPDSARSQQTALPAVAERRPSIVLILMDDFSTELLSTMRQALRMRREGAFYRHAYVVDSLCCPSRTSLLTGRYPHQTGVRTNTPNSASRPVGGYQAFTAHDNEQRTFALTLQAGGYRTGFIGKYLNGYDVQRTSSGLRTPPVQPGWTDWHPILQGYSQWGFWTSRVVDGKLRVTRETQPQARASRAERDAYYGTDVTADEAVDFIAAHRDDDQPYFLEVATYAPHTRMGAAYPGDPIFPPAFRDRPSRLRPWGDCGARRCQDLSVRDLPGFDDPRGDNAPTYLRRDGSTRPAPPWRTNRISMTARSAVGYLRQRARMVQAVDRLLARVRAEVGPDTYVVLTSDNGFHLGQHQLNGGKGTPYDSDTRVPLIVTGPGVVPGPRDQFVSNVDLAPTFEAWAGVQTPSFRSGRSFAESVAQPGARGDRFVFVEHTWSEAQPGEVDADRGSGGTISFIPSYVAVRSARGLLVRFDLDDSWTGHRYAWELYDYDRVPWEDRNVFARLHDRPWVKDLRRRLERFEGCRPRECRDLVR